MSQIISTILGLVIGVVAFMALQSIIPSITKSKFVAIFVFIVCWGAGICVSYIAWQFAIVIGIIALIVYIIKKRKPLEIKDEDIKNLTVADTQTIENPNTEDSDEL